jgi:hypothetical protein
VDEHEDGRCGDTFQAGWLVPCAQKDLTLICQEQTGSPAIHRSIGTFDNQGRQPFTDDAVPATLFIMQNHFK